MMKELLMKRNLKKIDSNSFSLLEVIIVIVIIGILASVITIPSIDNTLQIESDKMENYFRTAHATGLKWDGFDVSKDYWSAVCFEVNESNNTISAYIKNKDSKEFLKDALDQKELKNVKFKSKISASFTIICFSPFGDLFDNNISKTNLITKQNEINLTLNGKIKTLIIEPTGLIH